MCQICPRDRLVTSWQPLVAREKKNYIPELVGKWLLEAAGCCQVKLIAKRVLHKNPPCDCFGCQQTGSFMEDCEDLASTRRAVVKLCCSQHHSKGPAFTLKSARRVLVLGVFWCSTIYLFVTNFILHLGVIGALIVDFTATASNLQIPPAKTVTEIFAFFPSDRCFRGI